MAAERDPSVEPPSKEAIAKMLEPILKVKIKKLVKYVCDEPKFEMVLEDGSVLSLGTIDKIINQRHKNVIAAHKGQDHQDH